MPSLLADAAAFDAFHGRKAIVTTAFLTPAEAGSSPSSFPRRVRGTGYGMCDGVMGDDRVHVTVDAGNMRSLILDGKATNGFVQSQVRCKGKAPDFFMGSCDDPLIRSAWHCDPDTGPGSAVAFPYVAEVLGRLQRRCAGHAMDVLMLGLGGGTMQSHLAATCPNAHVLTVEASSAVLAAAQRFFGFESNGDVRLEDARDALRELVEQPRRFDAVVVDITDTVLQPSDVQNLHTLLKDGGVVLHNHTNYRKMMEQLDTVTNVFPHVEQQSFPGGNVLMSYSKGAPLDVIQS